MNTMNIALPESMKEFVQGQVSKGGYSSVSEYVRALIRTEQRRQVEEALETEILQGLNSGPSTPMTAEDWQEIRREVRQRYAKRKQNGTPKRRRRGE